MLLTHENVDRAVAVRARVIKLGDEVAAENVKSVLLAHGIELMDKLEGTVWRVVER